VDDNLLRQTPIGKWCYDAFNALSENCDGSHTTALQTLIFFKEINRVFIQDAAVIMLLHPDQSDHSVFKELGCFHSSEFAAFKAKMKVALETEECPMDAKLEHVIPGIHQWHAANQSAVKNVEAKLDTFCDRVTEAFAGLTQSIKVNQHESDKRLAEGFLKAAQHLLGIREGVEPAALSPPQPDIILDASPAVVVVDDLPTFFRMKPQHTCLLDLWNEWYGIDEWGADGCGGIDGRNKSNKGPSWRKHLESQQYSRTKRIVHALMSTAADRRRLPEELIADLETVFKVECSCSVAKFVAWCQNNGMLKKQRPRGKRA
jgi:Transcriptional activator of glycolytic enzymes